MNSEKFIQMKDKICKLIELGESESKLGNEGAAALITNKVQELMQKFHFEQSEFEKEHPEIEFQPLIGFSTIENLFLSKRPKEIRKYWAEFLANAIASNYHCKVTVNTRNGNLNFYGIDFDRDIAILMFEKLTSMAIEFCNNEMEKAKKMVGKTAFDFKNKKTVVYPKIWMGDDNFINSFMLGFGQKLESNSIQTQTSENGEGIGRIDDFINKSMQYRETAIVFSPLVIYEEVISIGAKYANFTAKQKTNKVQKSANIEISKRIRAVKDDRIGEVWILLDRSDSMSFGNKMKDAKAGAIDFALDAVSKKFAVGLISFDDKIEINSDPILEITESWKSSANSLYARGGTSLFAAIQKAVNQWKSYHRFKKVILIATDGEPTDNTKEQILEYGNLIKASGIEIFTVGTEDADAEFLKNLSSGNKTLQVSDSGIRNALKGMAGYLNA